MRELKAGVCGWKRVRMQQRTFVRRRAGSVRCSLARCVMQLALDWQKHLKNVRNHVRLDGESSGNVNKLRKLLAHH